MAPNALSNALTAAESAWLDRVENLTAKIEKVFDDIPTHLSPSALATAAKNLRGCNQDLARLGSPSQRLRAVQALMQKGCAQHDKGAQCFAAAARVGILFAGSAAARTLDKAVRTNLGSDRRGSHHRRGHHELAVDACPARRIAAASPSNSLKRSDTGPAAQRVY